MRVHTVVISTQHDPEVSQDEIVDGVIEKIIRPTIPAQLLDERTVYHINPTGRFVIGGPHGDCGLTGRKIIVDTYGGYGRHGGGAFSGKDPTKVDRSACYMARYIAKNMVAAGLAERVEVQLAYAIGVAEPVSVRVDSFGTGEVTDRHMESLVREHFPLTPRGIIETSTCAGRSTGRPRPTATSAARRRGSPGSRRTAPPSCAPPRACRGFRPWWPRPETQASAMEERPAPAGLSSRRRGAGPSLCRRIKASPCFVLTSTGQRAGVRDLVWTGTPGVLAYRESARDILAIWRLWIILNCGNLSTIC